MDMSDRLGQFVGHPAVFFHRDITFRRIVLKNAYNKRKVYETLLENVPMLKTLNVSTVAPVLVATSIKQAPVLSKHFLSPQMILHANEPVFSKHLPNLASGQ